MATRYTEVDVFLEEMVRRGWEIVELVEEDEDENHVGKFTPKAASDWIHEYDEAHLYIRKGHDLDYTTVWLYFVLGNEPGTALSDYTVNDEVDEVSTKIYEAYQDLPDPYARREVKF